MLNNLKNQLIFLLFFSALNLQLSDKAFSAPIFPKAACFRFLDRIFLGTFGSTHLKDTSVDREIKVEVSKRSTAFSSHLWGKITIAQPQDLPPVVLEGVIKPTFDFVYFPIYRYPSLLPNEGFINYPKPYSRFQIEPIDGHGSYYLMDLKYNSSVKKIDIPSRPAKDGNFVSQYETECFAHSYPSFMAQFGYYVDNNKFVLPSSERFNYLADQIPKESMWATGPRFIDVPYLSFQYIHPFRFFDYLVQGYIPLASRGIYFDHDQIKDHKLGSLFISPEIFKRFRDGALFTHELSQIKEVQESADLMSSMKDAMEEYSKFWDSVTSSFSADVFETLKPESRVSFGNFDYNLKLLIIYSYRAKFQIAIADFIKKNPALAPKVDALIKKYNLFQVRENTTEAYDSNQLSLSQFIMDETRKIKRKISQLKKQNSQKTSKRAIK